MKQIASPGLMHDTGCSGLVHWDDPEGGGGEGGGRGIQNGKYMSLTVDSSQLWQSQYNIVKYKNKIK